MYDPFMGTGSMAYVSSARPVSRIEISFNVPLSPLLTLVLK